MNSPTTIAPWHYDKRKIIQFFTHLIVLAMLFFLPEVMLNMSRPQPNGVTGWIFYLKPALYCVAFYINYYYIIDRSLGHKYGVWKLLGYNSILLVVMLIVLYLVTLNFIPEHHQPPRHLVGRPEAHHTAKALSFLVRDIVILTLAIALAVALKVSDKWLKLDRKQHILQSYQREEELKSLKSQLNPHFLFNTLNNIYALIAISPDKAQKAVHDLSHLLRYVLYEDNSAVKLSQELDFIDNYVKLMRLRLGDKLKVNVCLDSGDYGDCLIAPLLFISLVENAFKHGNTGIPEHQIDISITCKDGIINCLIANFYCPDDHSKDSSGIGIVNLRRRLDLIYGDNAKMNTTITPDKYIVNLVINLNNPQQ